MKETRYATINENKTCIIVDEQAHMDRFQYDKKLMINNSFITIHESVPTQ